MVPTSQSNLIAAPLSSVDVDDGLVMMFKFLTSLWPIGGGVTVFYAQENGVALPPDPCIMINTVYTKRLEQNVHTFPGDGIKTITQQSEVSIQLDFFGSGAQSRMAQFVTLWRDSYAFDWFKAANLPVSPLYATERRQVQFINESDNFEQRWTVEALLQTSQSVTLSVETAINPGTFNLIEVDAGQTI